ncbi:MAG TPA: EAL domain-containing protein [Gammaproteobacteria bacterium]|nr:EAL domain-containing protein [Gammaproteobacteria bacterium]
MIQLADFTIVNARRHGAFPFPLSTRLYPEWPFVKLKHTPDDLARQVAVALLQMPGDSPAALAARIRGWTVPMDYQPVHELMSELDIGPYAQDPPVPLAGVLRQHWYWFALPLVVALALAAHAARIRRLVARRTAELSRVNDELRKEVATRSAAEAALRESQRSHATLLSNLPGMVYRCANNADWTMHYVSEGAAALTGHAPADLVSGGALSYAELIHPDDRQRVWDEVQQALGARLPFQLVYRIVTAEGLEKWVWEQGRAVFGGDGKVQALEGYITDISGQKRAEYALQSILDSTASVVGEEFFRNLVKQLARVLGVRYACVTELVAADRLRTKAFWADGEFAESYVYSTRGAPCEKVIEKGVAHFPAGVRHLFPQDSFLEDKGIESYFAVALKDKDGRPLGHLAVLDVEPLEDVSLAEPLLRIFAARAGAELARERTEQERVRLSNHVRLLLDATDEGIYGIDDQGRCTFVNRAAARMIGHPPVKILGRNVHKLTHHTRADGSPYPSRECPMCHVLQNGVGCRVDDEVFWRADGRPFPVEYSAYPIREDGRVSGAVVVFSDITARKAAEDALHKSNARLAQAQRIAQLGNWDWDVVSGELVWSDEVYRIFGLKPGATAPTHEGFLAAVHPDDREFVVSAINKALHGVEPYSVEHRIRLPDGSQRLVHEQGEVSFDAEGRPQRIVGTVQDITARKRAEERLNYLAFYDALTGLPNRVLFHDRLNQALLEAARHDRIVAVMFMDLDRFKAINDTMGHETGDKLLKGVAERIVHCIREGDTLARLGGDEFTVVLTEVEKVQDAAKVAQKILKALSQPFNISEREFFITASIGITLYPYDDQDINGLLKNADTAMYHAKEQGKNNYQFYSEEMTAAAFERLVLENSLRQAITREEFILYYQPQLHLQSGRVLAVEALVRWQHPEFGLLLPEKFIPLAEDTGLIVEFGEWMVKAACAQMKEWQACGISGVRMAVNISSRQFINKGLVSSVKLALNHSGLAAEYLDLELTESAFMQDEAQTIQLLNDLKALGVTVSVDDFGTGYSNLAYLKRFAVDALKIDKSFIRDLTEDPGDAALTSAIITMGHSLNMAVVAEGVETEAQQAFLKSRRCDIVQGHYYSPPRPPLEIYRLLRDSQRRKGRPRQATVQGSD